MKQPFHLWTIFKTFVSVVIASLIIAFSFVKFMEYNDLVIVTVSGGSMEPTYYSGDTFLLKKEESFLKNDLILFDTPKSWESVGLDDESIIKRIIAVPGDTLTFENNTFYVNDEEVFTFNGTNTVCDNPLSNYSHTLVDDEIFVLGDNYPHTFDSRAVFCLGVKDFYVHSSDVKAYGKMRWGTLPRLG